MKNIENLAYNFKGLLNNLVEEHSIDKLTLYPQGSPSTDCRSYNNYLVDTSDLPIELDAEQEQIVENINKEIESFFVEFLGIIYCGGNTWTCAYNSTIEENYKESALELIQEFKERANELF